MSFKNVRSSDLHSSCSDDVENTDSKASLACAVWEKQQCEKTPFIWTKSMHAAYLAVAELEILPCLIFFSPDRDKHLSSGSAHPALKCTESVVTSCSARRNLYLLGFARRLLFFFRSRRGRRLVWVRRRAVVRVRIAGSAAARALALPRENVEVRQRRPKLVRLADRVEVQLA